MKASIIVPTFNGAHKIINLLKSLEQQRVKDFEVIVVIDGSTDGTKTILENNFFNLPELVILDQPNGGRSVSRNTGAKHAKGNLLLFFDDDMRLAVDCVETHLEHHCRQEKTILIGATLEDYTLITTDIQVYRANLSRKWLRPISGLNKPLTKEQLFLTAANFSLAKELFFELEGFDERLTDAEDFDFGVRAYVSNIPIFFNEKAISWHDDFITCRSYIRRLKQYKLAHSKLKSLKPTLYKDFSHYQAKPLALHKKIMFKVLSNYLFIDLIDKGKLKGILPKNWRYKFYDMVITSHII